MFNNNFIYIRKRTVGTAIILIISFLEILQANTLQENIAEVLNTNPVIQERLRNFRLTQQDLNIAQSEYYPSVDLKGTTGHYVAGNIKDEVKDVDYNSYQTSLTITQNLFNGFGTVHKVDYEKARIIAAGYKYIEISNDMAFKMTTVYLDLLRAQQLLKISRENVVVNEEMYLKVKELFDAGLTTDSEVKKIASSLSLARSNLTVKRNTAIDREYSYKRVFGRMLTIETMKKPTLDIKMPSSIQRATLYAVEHNPSILVSNYNIKASQSLWKQRKKDYYPKLDFVIEQKYNDANPIDNGYDNADDRFGAKLQFTYNLYRGGADKANVQKHVSMINQEVDIRRDLQRQVIEDLELSWNSYEMIDAQLIDLKDYYKYSEDTLELYNQEFSLGRRTLLELLTAQNDAIGSHSQVVEAQYDALLARYRILDAMGLLVLSIQGSDNIGDMVNISKNDIETQEILDTIPVRLDIDGDNVVDNIDICDNSIKANNIMPYGCIKIKRDNDNDGVSDIYDRCPASPKGDAVNEHGCAVVIIPEDENEDNSFNMDDMDSSELSIGEVSLDKEEVIENIVEEKVATEDIVEEKVATEDIAEEMDEIQELTLNFKVNSDQIKNDDMIKLEKFYEYLQRNKNLKAHIVGHTSRTKVSNYQYNINLSKKRAQGIKDMLVSLDINQNRLTTEGKGFLEPISDNDTEEGRYLNQRIVVKLTNEEL